ncbi:MAG TPA: hypothetical protein VFT35_10160 [Gaiellaceae bacterium]|nr:hypothetical protein [Gaiellaceae bacterium]
MTETPSTDTSSEPRSDASTPRRTDAYRRRSDSGGSRRTGVRLGAVVAFVLAGWFLVWLFLANTGGDGESRQTTGERTVAALSQRGLETLARAFGTPVYWAGPKSGVSYEVTQTPSNRVFVRYLPEGAEVGTEDPYLFVATFPLEDAFAVTSAEANKSGAVKIPIANGGVAFYTRQSPTNVYIAFPGQDQQIQVYDPDAANAQQLVADGAIGPVLPSSAPSTEATTVEAATLAEVKALGGKLGHPVYWVGPQSGALYELTQTPSGRVFIRYLPAGEKVGSATPHLFVATFPVPNALAVTQQAAESGVKIPIAGGGVAFYSKSTPSNVYVAFPNSDYQIEVYDPDPKRAQGLVRSGKVKPTS